MKKKLIYLFVFLLIVPVQATLLPRFSFFGAVPDFGLIAVYLIGFRFGEMDGVLMGMSIGFVLDFFSVGVLGVNFLLRSAVGLGAGLLGRAFMDMTLPVNFAIVFLVSLVQDLVAYLLLNLVSELQGIFYLFGHSLLPRALYTAGVATFCFYFLGRRSKLGGIQLGEGVLFTPGGNSGASK
jgi:rod shape-determining protein MreD